MIAARLRVRGHRPDPRADAGRHPRRRGPAPAPDRHRPKPMMPLVDRPFVAHQLDLLRRHGVTDVVFSCGYRPDATCAASATATGRACGCATWSIRSRSAPPARSRTRRGSSMAAVPGAERRHPHRPRPQRRDGGPRAAGGRGHGGPDPGGGPERLRPGAPASRTTRSRPSSRSPPRGAAARASRSPSTPAPTCWRPRCSTHPAGPGVLGRARGLPALAEAGALFGFPSDAYWRDIGTPASYLAAHHDVLSGAARTESPTGDAYLGLGAVADRRRVGGPAVERGAGRPRRRRRGRRGQRRGAGTRGGGGGGRARRHRRRGRNGRPAGRPRAGGGRRRRALIGPGVTVDGSEPVRHRGRASGAGRPVA